jgi:hypothetical protein
VASTLLDVLQIPQRGSRAMWGPTVDFFFLISLLAYPSEFRFAELTETVYYMGW